MADIWTKSKRSEVMSLIRSQGNKATERRLVELFRAHRIIGWRRKQKLPGRPDFVFRQQHVCVFVDGCFWHGCPRCYRRPSSNRKYWDEKVKRNRVRDRKVRRHLRQNGWRVLSIWECDLSRRCSNRVAKGLKRALEGTL